MVEYRWGQGVDAHRLVKGRSLILGGVAIPYEFGLLGHSDADVLTHAIIDAILGALALGDIGQWFPDTDQAFHNANSMTLLRSVLGSASLSKWSISNLDSTVIAQQPKLATHIPAIRQSLAETFNCGIEKISVKAKTTEGMGFCGRSEGIGCMAVISMRSS